MLNKYLRIRLKGNTLIEVLVASCILLFVSAISGLIYMNVLKNSTANIQFKAQEMIATDYLSIQQTKQLSEKVWTTEGLQITKKINEIPYLSNTFKINYAVEFDLQTVYTTYYLYTLQ